MKPEEQRIAIATLCGWKSPNPKHFRASTPIHPLWKHVPEWDGVRGSATSTPRHVPDYLNDLNAMHSAEKILSPEQEELYVHHLGSLIMSDVYEDSDIRYQKSNLSSFDSAYRATASQRAEAFLKTIGKWKQG